MEHVTESVLKFEAGRTYTAASIGDSECKWTFLVVRRTAKTVWIQEVSPRGNAFSVAGGEAVKARRPFVYRGTEHVQPFGSYSMALVVGADDADLISQ